MSEVASLFGELKSSASIFHNLRISKSFAGSCFSPESARCGGDINRALHYYRLNIQLDSVVESYMPSRVSAHLDGIIDHILMEAENVDIVSFDVFDTVVTRKVDSPADAFAIVEERLVAIHGQSADGFAKAREHAELLARERAWLAGKEEINYDEIYASFLLNFSSYAGVLNDARQIEIAVEEEVIIPVEEMKNVIDRLNILGKRVIFVSDMYLSQEFIGSILEGIGYKITDNLYVSNELGLTKGSGQIWHLVKQKEGVELSYLHIGDDNWADVETPVKFGIKTVEFGAYRTERRVADRFDKDLVPFSLMQRHTRLALDTAHANWWARQGSVLGAIVVYSFINWLKNRVKANSIKHVYFCARDGYLLKRAWDVLDLDRELNLTSSYLYVSRKPLNFSTGYLDSSPNKLSSTFCDFLTVTYRGISFRKVVERLQIDQTPELLSDAGRTFGDLDRIYDDWHDRATLIDFIQRHSEAIYKKSNEIYESTSEYFRQEGLFSIDNAAIVDLGWSGTLQVGINKLLKAQGIERKVTGFYYGLNTNAAGNRYRAGWMEAAFGSDYILFEDQAYLRNAVDVLETLHSAPHGSVAGYRVEGRKWVPVMADNDVENTQFQNVVAPFQEGVLESIQIWRDGGSVAGVAGERITLNSAKAALDATFCSPTNEEIQMYGSIKCCPSFEHGTFVELLDVPFPTERDKIARALFSTGWPIGLAKTWMNKHRDSEFASEISDHASNNFGKRSARQFNM